MTHASIILCALVVSALPAGAAALTNGRFEWRLPAGGQTLSIRTRPEGEELLAAGRSSPGFTVAGSRRTPLDHCTLGADGRLTASSADGRLAAVWRVRTADRYVALHLERLDGIPADPGVTLHFELNGSSRMRVTELDYMTRVENTPGGPRVHLDDLWHRTPGEPLGGFALYVRADEADEDETLLRIWAAEDVAHPKVDGEWNLDRARAWLAEWQRTFAERSQMILEGDSLDELRSALPVAGKAGINEIYLFTQTWRTDNFWPGAHGNVHVNRAVFPRGEEDLRAFGEEVHALGMRLNLHYVSGGIGRDDPTYIGRHPDRRLAGWVRGTLAQAADARATELVLTPPRDAVYPPALPHFFEHNHLRIEDELVLVGAFEPGADGVWKLHRCRRGAFGTAAASHAAGAEAQGLVAAYGQNYVPENDSALLDEMAANYAGLINRCRVGHTEYDGAEIHCYNGRWGYRKFATRVYERIDHPVTAHDSSGTAPRCNFEYRFNASRRLLAGSCSFTHGNWSAPVALASPGRVASTLLDANFVLSQGSRGGALGLCKPEPMFAVSRRSLDAHGLTGRLIDTLLAWKAVSRLLTDEQRARLEAHFEPPPAGRMPEASRHVTARFVPVVRRAAGGYSISPVCVLTRAQGDIRWQQGQEHGALSPRQYFRPGEELQLENPLPAQPPKLILRVLWAHDGRGPTVPFKPGRERPPMAGAWDLFTTGNAPAAVPHAAVPNLRLQPAVSDLRQPDEGPLVTRIAAEGAGLRLTAANDTGAVQWADPRLLPEWSADFDLTGRRALGLRVTGDGSGALLLIAIAGRDYVVKVDFRGPREIVIPNGEVAWASGDWGWRMATKRVDYARQHGVRLGIGSLPAHAAASVLVEELTALAELPVSLKDPVIHAGGGTLSITGSVSSGQILQYDGGPTAALFDPNWQKQADLPAAPRGFVMPNGSAAVLVTSRAAGPPPWLEAQFLTEGEPMLVPEHK